MYIGSRKHIVMAAQCNKTVEGNVWSDEKE